MRILSYNVNGIRSALNKGLLEWIKEDMPDVLCLQEIKALREQIDVKAFDEEGYHFYCLPALKKGYSGVGLLTKTEPDFVSLGMDHALYDSEGRVIRADYGDYTIVNVYIPSGGMGEVRQAFKMQFLFDFHEYILRLREERPNLIVCGDFNIAHKPIDINHPERQVGVSGFLPEEREWLDHFEASGFIDSFRYFDKSPEKYSWWSYRAASRFRNVGWRIDYHWVSEIMKNRLKSASIRTEAVHSDHCPVEVVIDN